jgi:hypothetical protein
MAHAAGRADPKGTTATSFGIDAIAPSTARQGRVNRPISLIDARITRRI